MARHPHRPADPGDIDESRPKARKRRWPRRLAIGLGGLLALVLVAVLAILMVVIYTPAGTRFAVRRLVEWYDGRIPAEVTVNQIEGTLATGVELQGIQIADARGRPLVEVRALDARLSPWALLVGKLDIERAELVDPTVHLWTMGDPWSDLGARDPAGAPPEPETVGPDLPVDVEADLRVDGLTVIRHGIERELLVDNAVIEADVAAEGQSARVNLERALARLPASDLTVTSLSGLATWSSPLLTVERLEAETSWGTLERASLRYDALDEEGAVDLQAMVKAERVDELLGMPVDRPATVRLHGVGSVRGAWLQAEVDAAERAHLFASLLGALEPRIVASGFLRGEVAPDLLGLGGTRPLGVAGIASGWREDDEIAGRAALACTTCPEPLLAGIQTRFSLNPGGEVEIDLFTPGGRIETDTEFELEGPRGVRIEFEVDDLSRALGPLAPWIDLPPVRGALRGRVGCVPGQTCEFEIEGEHVQYEDYSARTLDARGEIDLALEPNRIDVRLDARDVTIGEQALARLQTRVQGTTKRLTVHGEATGPAGEQGRVAAVVRPGEALELELQEADLDFRGLQLRRLEPSTITLGEGDIQIDRLRVAAGGGQITLEGRLRDVGRSALDLTVQGVALGQLQSLLPGPPLRGRVDLEAHLEGRATAPTGTATGGIEDLVIATRAIGNVDLRAELTSRGLATDIEIIGPLAQKARLRMQLPLRVDLSERTAALERGGNLDVGLAVEGLRLAALELPQAWGGIVDLELRISGTTTDPVAGLEAFVSGLQVSDLELGSARLLAAYVDARVTANGELRSPHAARAELAASLPVEIDLWPFETSWRPTAEHRVALVVDRLNLASVASRLVKREVEGTLDFDLMAHAQDGRLDARLEAEGEGLAVSKVEIGAARVLAVYDRDRLESELRVSGPIARLIELEASVPVRVALDPPSVAWAPTGNHVLYGSIRDASLNVLAPLAELGPLTGEVDGTVALRGPLDDIQAGTRLVMERLSYDFRDLGQATLELAYANEELRFSARQQRDGYQWLLAEASVPLGIDLARGQTQWHRGRAHRIALWGAGVDDELVEAFLDLPDPVQFESSFRVSGGGTLQEFVVDAQARATLKQEGTFDTTVGAAFRLRPRAQALRVVVGPRGPSGLRALLETGADIPALVKGEIDLDDVPFEGRIEAEAFPVEGLAPFLPTAIHEPTGRLTMDMAAEGTLRDPHLGGRLAFRDGAFTIVQLNQRLEDLYADVRLDEGWIHLDDLAFASGNGGGSGTARLHVGRGTTYGQGRLALSELPVVKPGLPLMRLDGELEARLDATGELTRVDLVAHDTALDVLSLERIDAPARIPQHGGVIFVDERAREETEDEEEEERGILPDDFVLSFEIDEPVQVTGPQVDVTFDGAIAVASAEEGPRVTGAITAERGTIRAGPNEFDLERAELTLPSRGDLDPYVSAVATTETPEALVTVNVYGRLSRPQLRLSSNPPMAESDAFALLVTGSADASRVEGGTYEAQAASVLAAFQNPVLQRTLQERVGIDRVGVGFGEDVDQPILTVGKRFSRKIYVETQYYHNAPPDENQAEIRLEYIFRPPNWSVETFFGTAAEGGIGLWWRKRFGGPERQERTAPAEPLGPQSDRRVDEEEEAARDR